MIVFCFDCDGDVHVEEVHKGELEDRLARGAHYGRDIEMAQTLPRDLAMFTGLIVIDGHLAKAKPVDVVKSWKFE